MKKSVTVLIGSLNVDVDFHHAHCAGNHFAPGYDGYDVEEMHVGGRPVDEETLARYWQMHDGQKRSEMDVIRQIEQEVEHAIF